MREEWNLLMKGRPQTGWGGWDFDEEELLKMMEEVETDLVVSEMMCGNGTYGVQGPSTKQLTFLKGFVFLLKRQALASD